MLIPTLVMAALACALLGLAYSKGQHEAGLRRTAAITAEILPLLFFSLLAAGLVQVLLPTEVLSRWVGAESGLRGIFIGAVAGSLVTGGPYVCLPLAAALFRAGASVATVVAFLAGWSVWGLSRLPLEVGVIGWKFTLMRLASTLILPPLAGILAQLFFSSAG